MKRLVVCCDGTWNDTDNQSTDRNVFRIAKAIHGSQDTGGVLQVVLYLRGVGTSGLKARAGPGVARFRASTREPARANDGITDAAGRSWLRSRHAVPALASRLAAA